MNKWEVILETVGIDEKDYVKVSGYIEHHNKLERERSTTIESNSHSTLPITVKLISMIENLDNVEFIDTPTIDINEKKYMVTDIKISTPIGDVSAKEMDMKYIQKIEGININDIAKKLNEETKDNKVYIYNLFSNISITLDDTNNDIGFHSTHSYFKI